MDRRSILKAIGTLPFLSIAGCKPPTPRVSKWIAFADQIPEQTDKFEMRKIGDPNEPIRKGEILEFTEVTESPPSRFDIAEMEEGKLPTSTETTTTRTFIMYRLSENASHCIRQDKWEWRYVA